MRDHESPWVERAVLPIVLAFALGVIITDIVRDAERAVRAPTACAAPAESRP